VRVGFVNQTGAKPGGAEESLALLVRNLPKDIEPHMFLFEDGEFAQRLRDAGLNTTITPIPQTLRAVTRERPSALGALATPSIIVALSKLFASARLDLVHTNTMKAHLIGAPAARLAGKRSVMHLRDMVDGVGRIALRGVAKTCTRERIAISNTLSRWYGMRETTVIANPVDLTSYSVLPTRAQARHDLGIPDDDTPLIGIVGRINRWKGHDRFLRVAAAVNERRPIRCVIIGEARFRDVDFVPELHQLANALGIADRTSFVPWLNDPRIAYPALDVLCNCSEREPFGRTIIEAAACGVPTVAFDDGGAVDIIRDGKDGCVVAAGDERAFASAVLALVSDAVARAGIGEAARLGSTRFQSMAHALRVAEVLRRSAA
jgi:glycosyltransferase involved in cell wall biosynthesis